MTPAQYRALDAILTPTGRPIRHAVLIRDSVITDDDGIRPEKIPFSAVAAVNSPSWSEPRAIRNLPQSSSPAALTPRCRTCRDSWKRPIGRIAGANHPDHGVHLATTVMTWTPSATHSWGPPRSREWDQYPVSCSTPRSRAGRT